MDKPLKLFEPVVVGKGILIEEKPSVPEHAVRQVDLDARISCTQVVITEATEVFIERKSESFTWTCLSPEGEIVWPDKIEHNEQTNELKISFLEAQSGTLTFAFYGD